MTTFSTLSRRLILLAALMLLTLGVLIGASGPAAAQTAVAGNPTSLPLDSILARHGGLARWRGFGRVEYDLRWDAGTRKLADHQSVDLGSRRTLVAAADGTYRVGSDGREVWITPNAAALAGGKMPPRFYVGTPFYFFGIPFVLADPGAKSEAQARKTFDGKECDVTRVTFAPGTGDTPEDYYLLYADANTHEVRLVAYIVTYPALRGGKTLEELEPHALVYDEWQDADGLRVLKRGRFFNWNAKEAKVEGEPRGTIEFTGVRFATGPLPDSLFAKPTGAKTDNTPAK